MADISWPEGLRGPLVSTFNREDIVGFTESPLASGPPFVNPISEDTPSIMNITYQFKPGDARRFEIFLRENQIRFKSPWFNGPIIDPNWNARTPQECRYTTGGYPQLTGVTSGGIYTYSAQIIVRKIQTDDDEYSEEAKAMWLTNCGNINEGNAQLDIGLCDWP